MIWRCVLTVLLVAASVCGGQAEDAALNQLTQAEKDAGWKLLFDGKDASQWWRGFKQETLPAGWVVEEGTLVRKEKTGDLVSKEEFENFELSVEWKISEGGNSGIMFKVVEGDERPPYTGPEAQIQDDEKGHDPQKAGWMYALYPASVRTTKPAGEWNHFVLKCQRTAAGTYQCEHTMNGTKYVEYEIGSADWNERVAKSKFATHPAFAKAAKGHLCLQDHGNLVWFRNMKIRELPALGK